MKFSAFFHEVQTSRSHVTRALPSGLRFEFHVCTARLVSDLLQGNPTFETKFDFLQLFCLLIIKFYFSKKCNFEDNFSAKIEQSG